MPRIERWTLRPEDESLASRIYGFTTEAELSFVRWYLATQFTGGGAAVELGTALGRSTAAMLEGLRGNPRAATTQLHAYDRFEFDWWLAEHYAKQSGVEASGVRTGDSFLRLFEANLGAFRDRVEIHAGDLSAHPWRGGAIEFLFVDIMKDWATTRTVLESFFPALEPGLSLLVHQDYKHPFSPQILLTMYRLREYFEPAWTICGSGVSASVAFRCVRKPTRSEIDAALARGLCELGSYTIAEIEAALDHALSIVEGDPEEEVVLVRAARTVIYAELLAERPDFARPAAEVELVRWLVQERTWPYFKGCLPEAIFAAGGEVARRRFGEAPRAVEAESEALEEVRRLRREVERLQGSRFYRLASLFSRQRGRSAS